ncbi:ubiquitin family-domain-containing protein [Gigaspora rosea]|uniref:Ubiquitin family-domain-containing protein n=1 Tax=Gigaspora rosea TaxID=44941 RepID=A0A397UQY5_9GLOM|nr:ubiquitin family-domain-containing protein [Gigaspora rosea]
MDIEMNDYAMLMSENEVSCEIFDISEEGNLTLNAWSGHIYVLRTSCEPLECKTVSINIDTSNSIKDVKTKFFQIENIIHASAARLFFKGIELEDNYILSDYDIQPSSTLNIELSINIRVNIQFQTREIELEIDSADTILIVKEKLQNKEGTPSSQQCLFFDGDELQNDRRIWDYGIQRGSIIIARTLARGRGGKINIEMPDKILHLDIMKKDTVDKVKRKIYTKKGIHPDKQQLMFNGQVLENHRTLSSYQICIGSTITYLHKDYIHFFHAKFTDDKFKGILHGSNCTCNPVHSAELVFALKATCIREANSTLLGIEFEKKAGYGLHLNGFDGSDPNHECEALYRDFWTVHIMPNDCDELILEAVDPTTDPFLSAPTEIESRNTQSITFSPSFSASLSQEKAKKICRPAFVLSVNHGRNYVTWTWNLKTAGLEGGEYNSPKDIFIPSPRLIRKTKQLYDIAKYNAPLPTKALWSAPAQFKGTITFDVVIEQRFCSIFKPCSFFPIRRCQITRWKKLFKFPVNLSEL